MQINKVNTYHYNFLKFYSLESIAYISKTIGIRRQKMFNFLSLTYWFNFSELTQGQFIMLLFILFVIFDLSFPKRSKVNK